MCTCLASPPRSGAHRRICWHAKCILFVPIGQPLGNYSPASQMTTQTWPKKSHSGRVEFAFLLHLRHASSHLRTWCLGFLSFLAPIVPALLPICTAKHTKTTLPAYPHHTTSTTHVRFLVWLLKVDIKSLCAPPVPYCQRAELRHLYTDLPP